MDFDEPGDFEQDYHYVTTDDVRFRTVDLNKEVEGPQEEEWSRVDSLLAETPLLIAQQMSSEFEAASSRFRVFSRTRGRPQETMANIDLYLRECLSRDGSNPAVNTNTQMVTQ